VRPGWLVLWEKRDKFIRATRVYTRGKENSAREKEQEVASEGGNLWKKGMGTKEAGFHQKKRESPEQPKAVAKWSISRKDVKTNHRGEKMGEAGQFAASWGRWRKGGELRRRLSAEIGGLQVRDFS